MGCLLGCLLVALALPLAAQAVEKNAKDEDAAPVRQVTINDSHPSASATGGMRLPTNAEAEASYDAARRQYGSAMASDGSGVSATVIGPDGVPASVVLPDPNKTVVAGADYPHNVPLDSVRVVVDVENTTLRDVVGEIVGQAAQYTGPWTVKWRLKPDNTDLLDERVNLTAEAPFGQFVTLLTERVRNLSGVQLFVTTFHESRVILVTDTYN